MNTKTILVTGGAGFIGSNLTEALLAEGAHVVCLDNFSTGKEENIRPFRNHPRFRLIRGDIRDCDICLRACENADLVFHEAALGSVPRSVRDPVTTNEVNIGGFVKMLNAARECGVKRFIYAASSSTYGDSRTLPKVEEQIGRPLSPYAITKYVNELYADVFHSLYGIDCIGLRYFNVFGRRQDPDGAYAAVIPRFVRAMLHQERPVIHGDGTSSRDFTYIDNVVQANLLAAGPLPAEALNTVYNVACGTETDLNTLFRLLRRFLSEYDPEIAGIEPVYDPPRPGDIPHSLADISKARRLLGYHPCFDVESGLRHAVQWYTGQRTAADPRAGESGTP